ncbi:RNA-binding domain superfamily, partial [Arabidopsis thaliana x Arabidopsis arenosa]
MATCSKKSGTKVNLLGKRKPEDYLEFKPILKKHRDNLEHKVCPVTNKKVFVDNLSPETKVSYIIDFFKSVGRVVRVQLILNLKDKLTGSGFVEFASANEAEKALEEKNGEYLHNHKILIEAAKTAPRPKYCLDHKVWYEDYLRQESRLPIEDETPHDFVEQVLFVTNLSPQTKISDIKHFFKNVGEVVSVRLIVNHKGKHVGYGFVEFASANEANKALEEMNGEYLLDHMIFLDVAKTAPYPPRPKYNLAEILCYEDYLRRGSLLIEEDVTVLEGPDETPKPFVEAVAIRKKTLFVANLSHKTKPSHIINFFKDVGEVVHVRLIVDNKGKLVGYGFVEFASTNEAKKALEKKNGEYLHDRKISLGVATIAPHPTPKYCIDHKVWNEDYLRRENLLAEEDEAVEGLDETPVFVEDLAVRKKTLFVANLYHKTRLSHIISFFKDVGEVVRVRLIVDHMSERLGCGFVEFASAYEAKKALEMKISKALMGQFIFLDVAAIALCPLRPKYNLAEKLWYEDYLRQESLDDDLETKPNMKKQKVPLMDLFCGKKITISDD